MEITSVKYRKETNMLYISYKNIVTHAISLNNPGRRSVLAEIMHVLPNGLDVECCNLTLDLIRHKESKTKCPSIEAYSILELAEKIKDWTYNPNSDNQELYGTIYLSDGSFLTRVGNDGKEWWEHRFIPSVPELV